MSESKIILPGGTKPGGLVGPDGRPLSTTPPAAEDALPSHPRLRPVEIEEAREGGRALMVLVDPSGIAPQALAIAAEAMPVLMLLDGSVALDDLIDLIVRETGDPRAGESVRTLVKDLDQRLFLESPRVSAAQKSEVIGKAFADVMPRLMLRFFQTLVRHRRQMLIPEIAEEYLNLVDAAEGRIHARVTVARETDEAGRAAIAGQLSRVFGKDVVPHITVDSAIMGGVIVHVGDTVLDGSVRKRLASLRRRMLTGR